MPHALGRDLRFEEGRGPLMTPIDADEIDRLDGERFHEHLAPVYETVRRLRRELPAETTLIGFCGAPWTVATYMIAGHGTPDQAPARLFAYRDPEAMRRLLNDACRPFGRLSDPPDRGRRRCRADLRFLVGRARRSELSRPSASSRSREIVEQVRAVHPDVPIIGFPQGRRQPL